MSERQLVKRTVTREFAEDGTMASETVVEEYERVGNWWTQGNWRQGWWDDPLRQPHVTWVDSATQRVVTD